MIRINLGRESGEKGGREPSGSQGFSLGRLFGGGRKGGGRSGRGSALAQNFTTLLSLGVALALAFLPHIFFMQFRTLVNEQHVATKRKLQEDIQVSQAEVAKFGQYRRELESYEQQRKIVKERLQTVKSLIANRGTPVSVLDAIGQSLPQRAWLSEVDFNAKESKVVLVGNALSNDEVSDFMDKLSDSVFLSDIRLEDMATSTSSSLNGAELRTFRITAKPKFQLESVEVQDNSTPSKRGNTKAP